MNIKPKSIPKFQTGGVPQWYLDRYGNRTSLLKWDLNKRYDLANTNLNANDHRNAGNLDTVYRKNMAYIGTPAVVGQDIQSFYNSDANGMSAEEFVKFYNDNAAKIRNHWATNLTYNARTAGEHNPLFRRMFQNRSNQNASPGSEYNIGYLTNLEDIEGSSTWLRRMDLYETEFDPNNPDNNRVHELKLSNGLTALVYKKANGDIGLLGTPMKEVVITPNNNPSSSTGPKTPTLTGGKIPISHNEYGFDWNKIRVGLSRALPGLLAAGRLAGNIWNNNRVYGEAIKGIRPDLLQTYRTHRQVVGDEATKLAYYTRAAQGLTQAALPFTSDADRQMAYQYEAKRIGDLLRAEGDRADNAEIRRTSDESNQHQWDNIRRATEVANANVASINKANALVHNLIAQKHSANWTSWDNYLRGIESRVRQRYEEDKAFDRQIFAMLEENALANDPNVLAAYKDLQNALEKANNDYNDSKVIEASRRLQQARSNAVIESYKRIRDYRHNYDINPFFAKDGMKITYKKKDDLLYKASRDAVEHFRKMSKISSDALNRKKIKIEKLSSHPRGSRKYLQGGVAPFTIYTPVTLGGETTTQVSSGSTASTKSTKDEALKETLGLIKSLFEKVRGVKVDVSNFVNKFNNLFRRNALFGNEISTDDLAAMYLSALNDLNEIDRGQKIYDNTVDVIKNNDAWNEYAVTQNGGYLVLDSDGKLKQVTLSELKAKKLTPITNQELLYLREYAMPFEQGNALMESVASNAVGMSKITDHINKLAEHVGSSDITLEGYTQHLQGQIRRGLELLREAPTGDYKFKNHTEDLLIQMQAAFRYITSALPKNMRAVLEAHAVENGITSNDMISLALASRQNSLVSQEFDAVTGKAAKDANGNSKDNSGEIKLDAATALISGKGYKESMEFNTGTSYAVKVNGIHTEFLKNTGENMGLITMDEALQSSLKGVLDFDKATLGGSRLNPVAYNHVLINNGNVIGVDLPVGNDKNTPDFTMLKKLLLLDLELLKKGIEDNSDNFKKVNEMCYSLGIPLKYDNSGKLNTQNWNRFAAFLVTTDDTVLLDKNVVLEDIIKTADASMRDLYELFLQSKTPTKDYDLSDGFLGFGKQELYQGTVFVPVKSNYVGATISGGQKISMSLATDLELKEQGYDKLKIGSYTKQYKPSDLND